MAKDPAVLFYTSDFLTGTMFMNNEQVGIYMRLLCAQHQHGGLIDKVSFNSMVGSHDVVRVKFTETDEGFFNERLMKEMSKRAKKSSSLSANAKIGWKKRCKSNANASVLHMPIENENANENESIKKTTIQPKKVIKFVRDNPPSVQDVREYCHSKGSSIDPQAFHDKNSSLGWVDKNNVPYRDWKAVVRVWDNYRKQTAVAVSPAPTKRPVMIVVVEKIAAGKSNHEILHDLVGTYSEHAINEAIGQARGVKL